MSQLAENALTPSEWTNPFTLGSLSVDLSVESVGTFGQSAGGWESLLVVDRALELQCVTDLNVFHKRGLEAGEKGAAWVKSSCCGSEIQNFQF